MWFEAGPTGAFETFLIDDLTEVTPIYIYTLISILIMLAFLGARRFVPKLVIAIEGLLGELVLEVQKNK